LNECGFYLFSTSQRQRSTSSPAEGRAQKGYSVERYRQWVRGGCERLEKKNHVAMRRNKNQSRFLRFSEPLVSKKKDLVIKSNYI
jgi:hypothetical protein